MIDEQVLKLIEHALMQWQIERVRAIVRAYGVII